jgi:hypothetical protein
MLVLIVAVRFKLIACRLIKYAYVCSINFADFVVDIVIYLIPCIFNYAANSFRSPLLLSPILVNPIGPDEQFRKVLLPALCQVIFLYIPDNKNGFTIHFCRRWCYTLASMHQPVTCRTTTE